MKKVLFIFNKLVDYRIPIINRLAMDFDVSVACFSSVNIESSSCKFDIIILKQPIRYGPFCIHPDNIHKLCSNYDAVVSVGNIKELSLSSCVLKKRNYKFAFWTIGVSSKKGYDINQRWDWVRDWFYKKADALIFYSHYPVDKNIGKGFDKEKLFVADNTVEVLETIPGVGKDSIVFVGTLHKRKGVFYLLDAYRQALQENSALPELNIIGGGPEFQHISDWILQNKLGNKIFLRGPVYDRVLKRQFFQRAFVCISPMQAGLTVLESFGYGVPFVTMKNSITGGELFNIDDKKTGILLNDVNQLKDVIIDVARNPKSFITMGETAKNFYYHNRTPEMMASGLKKAIDYMFSH